jgi:hypothetical protein
VSGRTGQIRSRASTSAAEPVVPPASPATVHRSGTAMVTAAGKRGAMSIGMVRVYPAAPSAAAR